MLDNCGWCSFKDRNTAQPDLYYMEEDHYPSIRGTIVAPSVIMEKCTW